jgi:hypothetical protein
VTQVFLNYRRADEPFAVAMLDQRLSSRFGSQAVFLASKSIELGSRWEHEMLDAVRKSTALLVIIGRYWLGEKDEQGRRRIDNPTDFVRREILLAMGENKIVIPVRIETPRLLPADLPDVLHPLLERQDIELRFHTAGPDIDRLETKLRGLVPGLAKPKAEAPPGAPTYRDNATHNEFHHLVVDTFHAGPTFYGRAESPGGSGDRA